MKIPIFTGSAAALVTPFDETGALDLSAMGQLIDWHLANGTRALVVCATTGECATLTDKEWESVVTFALDRADGKIPVIVGAGKNDTAHALRLCRRAETLGAQGVLLVTPYYNKTTQSGLIRHFTEIADQTALPILLYNVPSRTGLSIAAETYATLAKHPRIFGTKEASGDFSLILKTKRLCPKDFALYSGNDDQIVPILALGGVGVISTMANVIPRETQRICELWAEGSGEEAAALQIRCQPLIQALFREVNPIPVKEALQQMGKISGTLRLPLVRIGSTAQRELFAAMKEFGLIS